MVSTASSRWKRAVGAAPGTGAEPVATTLVTPKPTEAASAPDADSTGVWSPK